MSVLLALALVSGLSTWYEDPHKDGLYAAAGPALREELGPDWRGATVDVTSGGRTVRVTISDWCACGDRHGQPTVIDLSPDAFRRLAPLGTGVIEVRVVRAGERSGPIPTPPATTTAAWPVVRLDRRRIR